MPQSLMRPPGGCLRSPAGLTLIEVMIALAVFSVGILAAASMQTNGVRSLTSARQRLCHATAAAGLLELALMQAYDEAAWQEGGHGPFVLPQGASRIAWEIVEDSPLPGAKHIRVTVYGLESKGRRHSISFDYLKVRDF